MATISLKTNIKDVQKKLRRIQRKQIPFAASQALNDVAWSIRNDTVRVLWPRSVQVKMKRFARVAFKVAKADGTPHKSPATKRDLRAAVVDSLNRQAFSRQIDGGIRLPYSSTHIAVPTHNALTATGKIKKAARLGSPKLFKMTLRKRNAPGLWMRVPGKGRGKNRRRSSLKLMYTLELKTHVPKSFPFFEFGVRRARRMFPKAMDKRLRVALQRAK